MGYINDNNFVFRAHGCIVLPWAAVACHSLSVCMDVSTWRWLIRNIPLLLVSVVDVVDLPPLSFLQQKS